MKKKLLAILLAVAMVVAFAVPAMAGNGNGNGNNKDAAPVNTFNFDVNNANFHCNDIEGENGRVWPDLTAFGVVDGKGNGGGNNKNKMADTFSVDRVGDSTTWKLNDTVVCPECGSTVWVTYSNNSGVPNGNNVQFQHEAPTRRWITITVTYFVDVPKCDIKCNVADCDFELGCTEDCECDDCGNGCDCGAVNHTCLLGCKTVCDHEFHYSEVIVKEKVLINIADGYNFRHRAPFTWMGGVLVTFPRWINETLFNSKAYDFHYVGQGDCVCECVCDGIPCDCGPVTPENEASVSVLKEWINDIGYDLTDVTVTFSDGDVSDDVNYDYGYPMFKYLDFEDGDEVSFTENVSGFIGEDNDYNYYWNLAKIELDGDEVDSATVALYNDENYILTFYNEITREPKTPPPPIEIINNDPIPSQEHYDRWWGFGILCLSSNTVYEDNYYWLAFADGFWDLFETVEVGYGTSNVFDHVAIATADGVSIDNGALVPYSNDFAVPFAPPKDAWGTHYFNGTGYYNGEQLYGAFFGNVNISGGMQAYRVKLTAKVGVTQDQIDEFFAVFAANRVKY